MDSEIHNILTAQQQKIDAIYASVEKTRKYLLWTMVATLVFLVLPLIGIMFIVPSFISSYGASLTELGL